MKTMIIKKAGQQFGGKTKFNCFRYNKLVTHFLAVVCSFLFWYCPITFS